MTARFRAMLREDRAFVVSMWSASFRMSENAGLVSMENWATVMHREIERIIDHPTVTTLVAWQPGQDAFPAGNFLYGFISYTADDRNDPYVYYVAVKSPYRKARTRLGLPAGFGEQLFAAAGIDPRRPFRYACETPYVSEMRSKIPLATYDPLPARYLRTYEHTKSSTEDRDSGTAAQQGGASADAQDLVRGRASPQRAKQR